MTNVKWLLSLTAVDTPFDGYQQTVGYRMRLDSDDDGVPVTRMVPRALLVPPGIPDFMTRTRTVVAGPCVLEGRAWSGSAPITAVDVSVDGGTTWDAAVLDGGASTAGTWIGWRYEWQATPGDYELCCRAADGAGSQQSLEAAWNVGGYANNTIQRVPVRVVAAVDHQA
jgi:hypothetical protein